MQLSFRFLFLIILFLFIISLPIDSFGNDYTLKTITEPTQKHYQSDYFSTYLYGLNILSISDILLVPALIAFVMLSRKKLSLIKIYRLDLILILFYILSQISVINSIDIAASTLWLIKLTFIYTIYFIFSRINLTPSVQKMLFFALVGAVCLQATLAMGQFFKGGLLGLPIEKIERVDVETFTFNVNQTPYFRVVGTLLHPNNLGKFMVLLLPSLLVFTYHQNKFKRLLASVTAFFAFFTILISLSRLSLVACLFSLSFFTYLVNRIIKIPFKRLINWRVATLVIIFITLFLIINPFTSRRFIQSIIYGDFNFQTRSQLIGESLYILHHQPEGIGGGADRVYLANYDYTESKIAKRVLYPVHQFYLLMANELGIISLAIILALILEIIWVFKSNIFRVDTISKLISIALFSSVVTFFFGGLFELWTFNNRYSSFFWIMLGLMVNILTARPKINISK